MNASKERENKLTVSLALQKIDEVGVLGVFMLGCGEVTLLKQRDGRQLLAKKKGRKRKPIFFVLDVEVIW